MILVASCGGPSGTYELEKSAADEYATGYIAAVVAGPEGDDLARGSGEHVVIRSNFELRTDMGGWVIQNADGNRLLLGFGRQLDPGAELRAYTSCGVDTEEAVFACLADEVLDDDGEVVRLLDAGGSEVARFGYGTTAE